MKRIFFFFLSAFSFPVSFSQLPKTYTSSEILHQVKKLKVLGTVLYIAAHPDDENTRLIAYLSNEKQYRTGYLSMTRGDGGQNLIGDEQGIELGLIRTEELLAARRIDGGEQFFTRAYDFGYSKSTEEALKTWDKEKILSDVVWVIRKFQPDVIITRFPPDDRGGHGHHSASAVLAAEAFDAAADPARFPEQFKYGVNPWQAKRILWNTYRFGDFNTTDSTQFTVDVGGFNTLLGKSYGEIAAESRSQHKSQGFGVPRTRGSQTEFFSLTKGDKPVKDLTDGVEVSWKRVDGSGTVEKKIDEIIAAYNFEKPEKSVKALIELRNVIQGLSSASFSESLRAAKIKETEDIIRNCLGVYAEAAAASQFISKGDSLSINLYVISRSGIELKLKPLGVFQDGDRKALKPVKGLVKEQALVPNKAFSFAAKIAVDSTDPLTQPYWLIKEKETGAYQVDDQNKIGQPAPDMAFSFGYQVEVDGATMEYHVPVQYKYNDPVKGELYQPLAVVPQMDIKFQQDNYMSINEKPVTVVAVVKANGSDPVVHTILKKIPGNWATNKASITYVPKGNNSLEDSSQFVPKPNSVNSVATLSLENKDAFTGYKRTIQYDHVPAITYFKPAKTHLLDLGIKTVGKNIGYIEGAGDKVAEDLSQLGYNVTILKEDKVTVENLKQFDAVITGVRAYNVHTWLTAKYDVLMSYVKNGGNLIVQYNTNSGAGPLKAKIAPYPVNISRNRITDETAKVNFLLPEHPALNYPNKITAKDFDGWIQERSIYHAEQFDSVYAAPLSMADPGEKENNGALIIALFGRGNFVYTGIVFFRELPAGVPGAYRLMANLIALPKRLKG